LELLHTLVSFFTAILILVTLHELGHFAVARWCGVKVLRFSVGFGKVLWSRTDKQGTEYCLAAIPLGGYVKMLDEREGEVAPELLDQAFTQKNVWQRIAIVVAGPLANFILAVVLYWVVFLPGITAVSPVIGSVDASGLAAEAGLESGQEIVAVDGRPTATQQAFMQALLNRLGESGELMLTVRYSDSDLEYHSTIELNEWLKGVDAPDPIKGLGMSLYRPVLDKVVVRFLSPNEPAEQAGLKVADQLLSIDGELITGWDGWAAYVRSKAGESVRLEVLREHKTLFLDLIPRAKTTEKGEMVGFVGVSPEPAVWPKEMLRHYKYGPVEALFKSIEVTWDTSVSVLISVKKLILGEISTKNLSGPITIAKVAGDRAGYGILSFIEFLAMISVFLGVFNLLPIPVLDGGHLLYYVIEVIKGSPVPESIQQAGYQMGMVMVLGLMCLAFYNDIMRL